MSDTKGILKFVAAILTFAALFGALCGLPVAGFYFAINGHPLLAILCFAALVVWLVRGWKGSSDSFGV